MIQQEPLTAEEMARSRYNYNVYCLINGASYMCLGETVLILFAVRLNCPNALVAVLGAMVYFGFLLLPLGKWVTARVGAAQSQADFWVMRNFAALVVFFAAPVAVWVNQTLALCMIVAGAFFFFGFRAAGVVMSQPLMTEICEPEVRGLFVAKSTMLFYLTGTVTLALICLIVHYSESIWAMAAVILAGSCLGLTASRFFRRIRETPAVRDSARKPIRETLRKALADRLVRRQLWAGVTCNLAVILAQPISILALKRGYLVSDMEALCFSLAMFGAKVAGGFLQTKIAGKLGPKRLTACGYWLFPLVCLFWIFVPRGVHPLWLTVPLMLCGLGNFTVENGMQFYFLTSVRKELQVTASILIAVATGVGAGLTGMVLGSILLKTAERWQLAADPTRLYRAYFLMSLIFIVLGGFVIRRLDPVAAPQRKES